jgi:Recombination endonuclease VII
METCSRNKTVKISLPPDHPYAQGRTCTTCNEFKPAKEYELEKDKRAFGGVAMRSKCRVCDGTRKYKRFIQKTYGISYESYIELLEAQKYCCAICKSKVSSSRTTRLFVDHCHETLRVRGLLCSACNHGLGLFKDSPTLLRAAIHYLNPDKN